MSLPALTGLRAGAGLLLALWANSLLLQAAPAEGSPKFTLACSPANDLYAALTNSGHRVSRLDLPRTAIAQAPEGGAVLLLADNYPEGSTRIDSDDFALAEKKLLRMYLEYPAALPGQSLGAPKRSTWERAVVASDRLGSNLPWLRILALHDCHFLPLSAPNPLLVIARVAGFDTAVYGLPKERHPILFEIRERNLLVATTKLSGFATGRYAPAREWQAVWGFILQWLAPQRPAPLLTWAPIVAPRFGPTDRLPIDYEAQAFSAAAGWFLNARLLVHSTRSPGIEAALRANQETIPLPPADAPRGDGSLGILEGYASGIRHDGTQMQRVPLRADCNAESAMVLALDTAVAARRVAANLLDYVYFRSDLCGGARSDPKHGSYGLIGWGAISAVWQIANYGDDNARVLLATMLAAAALQTNRWDEPLLRGLMANLRTTGKLGFRGDRIDQPALQQHGWRHYYEGAPVNYSPHFESYLWACYLWAWRQTGFPPFLERATNAIAMTMQVYPRGWRWQDNLERARMLLCLAWLARVAGTPQYRDWLLRVVRDLLARQQPSGAIHEWLAGAGGGHYWIPQSNEAYGTGETPLIQQNGDPASDQLYTSGFALLGLHEANAVLNDPALKAAEDKLAEFLCRIQIRSARHPWLDGAWFRAFDDRRWEYWASSADAGWGAWSVEAGWGQAWTAAVLALRYQQTTLWDLTANSRVRVHFEKLRQTLLGD